MTKIESEDIFVQKISCAKSVAVKIQWEYRPQVHFEKTAFARFLAFSVRLQFSVLTWRQLRVMLQECLMNVLFKFGQDST